MNSIKSFHVYILILSSKGEGEMGNNQGPENVEIVVDDLHINPVSCLHARIFLCSLSVVSSMMYNFRLHIFFSTCTCAYTTQLASLCFL